jgi:thiol-disulfide isomerase/thioredoxin
VHCKIDRNNNLDFSDDEEVVVPDLRPNQSDSLAAQYSQLVTYESYANGPIKKKAPVLVVKRDTRVLANIPLHATATFSTYKIDIRSAQFATLDFSSFDIAVSSPTEKSQIYKQNDFVFMAGVTYKVSRVDLKDQSLILRRVPKDSVVMNGQIGFYAYPFQQNEFESGNPITLRQYKGKYLFIDFWGSWCSPCRAEMPRLRSTYRELDKTNIDFLGVAVESSQSLSEFLKKEPSLWKQIRADEDSPLVKGYNIDAYPTNILINPQGKIIKRNMSSATLLDSLKVIVSGKR